jgi:hypothetical protein
MKNFFGLFVAVAFASTAMAQQTALVRGVGTQTCANFVASSRANKQLEQQVTQWILGNMTGYFRQANNDLSRTLGDAALVQTVTEVCKKNADKTIDEATTIAIGAIPTTEVKKPGEIK